MNRLIFMNILFLTSSLLSQEAWQWQNPWPQGNSLLDVIAIDENKIIAVGSNSAILSTNDRGDTWQVSYYEELNTELKSIFFVDEDNGWICGTSFSEYEFGIVLRTENGGRSWDRVDIIPNVDLREIQFFDENLGWASGINSIFGLPYLFKTENGGQSWQARQMSDKEAADCHFRFFNPDTGIFNFRGHSYSEEGGEFLKTTNGGVSWDSTAHGFSTVYFADSKNGWAGLNRAGWYPWYTVHSTMDGGQTWQQDSTVSGGGLIRSIFFTDTLLTSNSGSFGFYNTDYGYYVDNFGLISKTEDRGRNWQDKSKTATTEDLNSVFFINENVGWAVGGSETLCWGCEPEVLQEGYLINTIDGGENWNYLEYHTDIVNFQLRKVQFPDRATGYVLGFNEELDWGGLKKSAIFKTHSAPQFWVTILEKKSTQFTDFHFRDKNNGFVIGEKNTFLITKDGGNTWTNSFPSCLDSNIQWEFNSIFFLTKQEGWLSVEYMYDGQKENLLLKTNNGGTTWDSLSNFYTNIIEDIYFITPDTGWFCGYYQADWEVNNSKHGFTAKTTNGGKYWQINEWYSKTESISDNLKLLHSIEFFDGKIGWAIGDDSYYTEDGGESWYLSMDNKLSGGNNDLFLLKNENTGWIVGNGGKVLKTTSGGIPNIIKEENKNLTPPVSFLLNQNYPNPFNPKTTIGYQLPKSSFIDLSIYNILGQEVATLVSEKLPAGNYKVEWDASGFTSGIYFYKLETKNGFIQTKKLIVLK